MNISLTSELEQLVHDKVKTGMYGTASEVIREGLRLLKERDQHLELLRREVQAGFAAVGQGKFTEYDSSKQEGVLSQVKERGRKRLAEEAKQAAK